MSNTFIGTEKDLSMILISAVRYALGRKTYIVAWTCEVVINNIKFLSDEDKYVIIRDIKSCDDLGWDCDKICWNTLLDKLNNSIISKGNIDENRK